MSFVAVNHLLILVHELSTSYTDYLCILVNKAVYIYSYIKYHLPYITFSYAFINANPDGWLENSEYTYTWPGFLFFYEVCLKRLQCASISPQTLHQWFVFSLLWSKNGANQILDSKRYVGAPFLRWMSLVTSLYAQVGNKMRLVVSYDKLVAHMK